MVNISVSSPEPAFEGHGAAGDGIFIGSPVTGDRAVRCDKMYHFADASATGVVFAGLSAPSVIAGNRARPRRR
jgi:hypothetical protein